MSQLRLMFQNQWNNTPNLDHWAEKGLDCSSEARMCGNARIYKEMLPDIVGGQEVNKDMQTDLRFACLEEGLPYTLIWGHMTPILYRADKLELLDTEYLMYPEYIEGLQGAFNDSKSKAANLGVFRCKEDGKVFIFVTTHLWWMHEDDPEDRFYFPGSHQARTLQLNMAMNLVKKYQEKYGACPVFLGGDLNTGYWSEAVQCALTKRGYSHAHDIAVEYADSGMGYNGCNIDHPGPGQWREDPFENAIDHILVRDVPEGAVRRFDRYTTDAYLALSDHAPVYVDVII